jgi:hypothetical protein
VVSQERTSRTPPSALKYAVPGWLEMTAPAIWLIDQRVRASGGNVFSVTPERGTRTLMHRKTEASRRADSVATPSL